MTSTLGVALLGVLARAPSTGYDLARLMRRPVGYFWSANHSQIYPELARLERDGLVDHEVIDGAGPRPTKRYAVTSAGLEALRAFVAADVEPGPVRDLETLKLWSVWAVSPPVARELIGQLRAAHAQRLDAYASELAEVNSRADSRDTRSPEFASRLTLEGGVRSRRAAVEWCDWMLSQFDEESSP